MQGQGICWLRKRENCTEACGSDRMQKQLLGFYAPLVWGGCRDAGMDGLGTGCYPDADS